MPRFVGARSDPARYNNAEYKQTKARLWAELRDAGHGLCAELICIMPSRAITPAMRLDVCHDRRTGAIRGLGHARCNRTEAARYGALKAAGNRAARRQQTGQPSRPQVDARARLRW